MKDQALASNHDHLTHKLRFWGAVGVLMAVSSELLHTLLIGNPSVMKLLVDWSFVKFVNVLGAYAGIPAVVLWIGGQSPRMRSFWQWFAIALGCVLCGYLMLLAGTQVLTNAVAVICFLLAPLGGLYWCVCVGSFGVFRGLPYPFKFQAQDNGFIRLYLQLSVLLTTLALATNSALEVNRVLFPASWDYFVYRLDAAFGNFGIGWAVVNDGAWPIVQTFTATAYAVLVVALYALVGVAMRQRQVASLNVWRTLVFPFVIAGFLYALLPVSGPLYAFFDQQFPHTMPNPMLVPASQVVTPPSFRNGMPSMHLVGALLAWTLALGLRHPVAKLLASILVAATVWSTLAGGEHYFLDLVVAFPLAAILSVALTFPQLLRNDPKMPLPFWLCVVNFVSWLLILRTAPVWLSHHLVWVQALSIWSTLIAAGVYWRITVYTHQPLGFHEMPEPVSNEKSMLPIASDKAPMWVITLFAVSGMAGLIYEVVYAKALAVTFGSTALASYTVLATYMGGMALGAWLGGMVADRNRNPLMAYAFCEAAIGVYAVLTPLLFKLIQGGYVYFSADVPPDAPWLTFLRLSLGVGCLGLPTVLMGATMPLMFKHLRSLGISSQRAVAPLYGANVTGAALGSLMAGYLLLPTLGRNGGTYVAALLSLMVALYAMDRLKRTDVISTNVPLGVLDSGTDVLAQSGLTAPNSTNTAFGVTALAILFLGGAVTLGLEVNSMHLLAVVAGNSVYAFALMLAMFLAGLGLGSFSGERLMARFERMDLVAWSQCGLAFAIAVTAQVWDDIPSYFSSFSIYPISASFASRETIRALVCAVAMLPPAFFIGMCYPASMSLASDWLSPRGGARGFGIASGINTLGNILGVVLIGFWLLPNWGSRNSALLMALLALALGLLALEVSRRSTAKIANVNRLSFGAVRWMPALAACAVLVVFPADWNFDELSTGSNVYFKAQNWGKVVDHAESVEGGVTSVALSPTGVSTLLTNGKFQGNNSAGGEMVAQESFALFPLLHTGKRDAALVIGYGTGMTTRVLHDVGFKRLDVAELSKDIVTLADRHFGSINHGVSGQAGVQMHITDGRNYLLTQSQRFDVISMEISSIWFAGAANLYNQDFYALAKKRLTDDGVLQQWVQLHHITPIDIAYVIGSVRSEFKYVWLYVRGGQGIIVASNSPNALKPPGDAPLLTDKGRANDEHRPDHLIKNLVLSPAGVDRFISSLDPTMRSIVSTDINLYLEHATPKGNVLGDVVARNIELLARFESGKNPALQLLNPAGGAPGPKPGGKTGVDSLQPVL